MNRSGAVILDATYRNKDDLDKLQWVCRKNAIRLLVIQTIAPVEVIQERLEKRETEPSISDLRSSDYVPERFEIAYPIEKYVEATPKINTRHEMTAIISRDIIPWLIQQTPSKTYNF